MNRLEGKTVLVTGASSGIGEACARNLAELGCNLILTARREERLRKLAETLQSNDSLRVRSVSLDVRDRAAIDRLVNDLADDDFLPYALVNNAGLARGLHKLHEGEIQDWEEMIDTNVKGLLYMSRAFLPSMVERNQGHVVNIGSIAGHMVYPAGNVYNATKFAVRALTQAMSVDLVGTNVRVSSVDPGMVETEFSEVRFRGDAERGRNVYRGYRPLRPEDIAEAVAFVLNAPEHVNVLDMLVMPTDQRNPYVMYKHE